MEANIGELEGDMAGEIEGGRKDDSRRKDVSERKDVR